MTRKFISIILMIAFLIVFLGIVIYFLTSYSYVKYISFINFYDKDIEVNMNGTKYTMRPFDTKLLVVNDLRDLDLKATSDGQEIFSENLNLTYTSEIIAAYFSELPHCYYQTNLGSDVDTMTYSKLEMKYKVLTYSDIDLDNNSYFLTGSNTLSVSKNNIGILPILCTDIDNKELVFKNNQLFLNYNSDLQREYYFQSIEKINNSTTIDGLQQINGVYYNQLKFYNFGGSKFYFLPK